MRWLFLFFLLLPRVALAADSFTSAHDQVTLVAQARAPEAGKIELGLQFRLAPGWHIYWSNPGDAGFAPAVAAAAPVTTGPLGFPPPALLMQGPIADYVLSGNVLLPFAATNVGNAVSVRARWLVCSDICVPEGANFLLRFPTVPVAFGGTGDVPSPFPSSLTPDGTLSVTGLGPAQVAAAHFFPLMPGVMANGAPQILGFTADGLTLKLDITPGAAPPAGILELTDRSGAMQALRVAPLRAAAVAPPPYLLLAFLGGLILNLMPCVFPVLALKALAMTRLGVGLRREALGYTAGVLVAMLLLGGALMVLQGLGTEAGWGFQFQHPWFVAVIAWLMFALALNMAGLFEFTLPGALRGVQAQHSVATGFLAVLLATPCTAPFMGVAIAGALAAPWGMALGIFLALGLGMAAPFLALAFIPGLARALPRPGAWMQGLRRFLALPMFATFCWLGWVLFRQTGWAGVALLLAGAAFLGLALAQPRRRALALAAVLLVPFLHADAGAALSLPGALPYSAAKLAALRASGTPVFVDLTASWCVTCLVNEATTLKNPEIRSAFAARHIVTLVGDWTQKSPDITALLAANGRAGVPLYLYYPASGAVVVLPQILDPEVVKKAIK
jgi:thiol:disulfide interchange protein DsbD